MPRFGSFMATTMLLLAAAGSVWGADAIPTPEPQYASGGISIPAATSDEPLRDTVSTELALQYLDDGARAWSEQRKCITCHTNGAYLEVRPALTRHLGTPPSTVRDFYVQQLKQMQDLPLEELRKGIHPTQIAYLAQGLAVWDAHVTGQRTAEADAALHLMFQVQAEDGSWNNTDCWPPLESSSYHGTTVAAMAATTLPEANQTVLDRPTNPQAAESRLSDNNIADTDRVVDNADLTSSGLQRLTSYLKETPPPHDYARVLLLRVAQRLPAVMDGAQRDATLAMIGRLQNDDGGWSMRSFAEPEAWGRGNRAEKLRGEPEFGNPPSDAHMTGLVVIALRESGVPANDDRIERAIDWLKSQQRESGRWWTRSLNNDKYHFISYHGTCYAMLALAQCDAL